ncbi:MAG: EamA family transporter [Planctomycetes bacterium]|nr:EamA family transporter [Planctomycetota bacterium]
MRPPFVTATGMAAMTAPVAMAFLAALGFGLGAAVQRRALARLGLEDAGAWATLRTAVADPLWLASCLIGAAAAGFYIAALGLGPMVVVQPIVSLQVAVAAGFGAVLLGERLRTREWVGLVMVLAAAAAMASFPPGESTRQPGPGTLLALGGAAVLAALALVSRRAHLGGELALGAAAGVLFGAAVPAGKTTLETLAHPDGWSPGALVEGPAWIFLALNAAGFVVVQRALSVGRVGVISPVLNLAATAVPVAMGVLAFGEPLGPGRAAAVAAILAGGALFVHGRTGSRPGPGGGIAG